MKALENWIRVEVQKRESKRWNDLPPRCHPHTFVEVCLESVIDTIDTVKVCWAKWLEMDTATLNAAHVLIGGPYLDFSHESCDGSGLEKHGDGQMVPRLKISLDRFLTPKLKEGPCFYWKSFLSVGHHIS